MLDVPDIQSIRVLHQRGHSERAIARILRINRRTVRRYLAEEVIEPERRMHLKEPRPSPKMDPWKGVVAEWVAAVHAWPSRTAAAG